MKRARWGKLRGVAGLAGVAATGVLVARDQRQRGAYSPEEVRARRRERHAAAAELPSPPPAEADPVTAGPGAGGRLRRLVRARRR
ncbi:hypothetical protein [Frankia sp. AgB32]|uniref:hypothetical protein n=1 Tax=Frankia sp. AgB32 TaxID=631119 RepID=UPI00200D98A8|nr:hypothetical protein [Frankia sp. AgB32]MCK9894112.1 hypothetical protein [Frankia sp. AgB32]